MLTRPVISHTFTIQYLLTTLEASVADILSFGVLRSPSGAAPGDVTRTLRLAIQHVCKALLPEAIGLTDAFAFTDWELDSALGVYDGKVYEALWKRAQADPMNLKEVPDAYEQSILPILKRGQRQVGVKIDKAKL